MADRIRISDLDFVYISYMEPNKEHNWADLKNKVPWAKRVDGVKGFDSAHKAAAEIAETDFFISVDGDNIIDERFLLETLDFGITDKKCVHRWRAKNNINGLIYGNGGLVGWSKDTCLNMKTHENADNDENQIDFCWGVPHVHLHNCYSTTIINATPKQAFIAGYREGVKMSTEKGKPLRPETFKHDIVPRNLRILSTWMTVGADVENGKYAMMGARAGCYKTVITEKDHLSVRDLEAMEKTYTEFLVPLIDQELLAYGESIRQRLDIPVADFNEADSKFYKFVIPPYRNKGVQDLEY
jgi:hypothetical protein